MTLEEIDVNAIEGVYGGYDESMWRMKFGQVHQQLQHVEGQLEALGSQSSAWTDPARDRAGLLGEPAGSASRSGPTARGVPRAWREPGE